MVRSPIALVLHAAFAAVAVSFAAPTQAEFYKWLDQNGNVIYSNVLPPEGAQVREIETIDEKRAPTATELRTRQILEDEARERRGTAMSEPPSTAGVAAQRGSAGYADSDPAGTRYEWIPQDARAALNPQIPDPSTLRYPPSTPVTVRDPCLVSPDPRCYQLNAANYDPYLGYAPNRESVVPMSTGATGGSGGSAAGAAVPPPASNTGGAIAPADNVRGAAGPAGSTGAAPSAGAVIAASGGVIARNAMTEPVIQTTAPAAPAASATARPFRGLPPGTVVLPIAR